MIMKRKLLLTTLALSLGCLFGGSGAMAQNGWESVYKQSKTTSDDWTKLDQGSLDGKVLGAKGVTNYYYITKSLNFTNDRTDNDGNGNSGLKILGTVYLYIPAGLHIECRGANADGRTGAGAGIELSEGNTLYIIGGGDGAYVKATGGNAENGRNGGDGASATGDYSSEKVTPGKGGKGGNGGGGAGAGIGTRGGTGGTGGDGGDLGTVAYKTTHNGAKGSDGTPGGTAGKMGNLYVDQTMGIKIIATSGQQGSSNGQGGKGGSHYLLDLAKNQSAAGGAGGGGGGCGGAGCDSGIGTGGPGGGAGGGGSSGSTRYKSNPDYYKVGATGGGSGMGADGQWHQDTFGASTLMSGKQYFNGDSFDDAGEENGTGAPERTNGNVCGNAASNGTTNEGKLEYTITYKFVKPDFKTEKGSYSPSSATTVVLPKNSDGYQWALVVYGKGASADGSDPSVIATATTQYFGSDSEIEALRTANFKDVYGNIEFQEVASACKLNSSGDNSQTINELFYNPNVDTHKYNISVRLMNRTLYKDGNWNTICLPCDLTEDQIKASPLAGAQIKKMDAVNTGYYQNGYNIPSANINTTEPTLILWFEDAKEIKAGKPYLVKWNEGSDLVDNTADVDPKDKDYSKKIRHDLDFTNVKVAEKTPGSWECNDVTFQGTFSLSRDIKAGDKTKMFLGKSNKLYYASEDINVGACRGYFILPDEASKAREVIMGFDEGVKTSIVTLKVNPEKQDDGAIYNLNGQRLNAPQKGINIINGKKVMIK